MGESYVLRYFLAVAKHQHRLMIAALIRTIFAHPDPDAARTQRRSVAEQLVIRPLGDPPFGAILVEVNDAMISSDRPYIAAGSVAILTEP